MAVMIAPSILAADFAKLGEEVRLVENAGAKMLHIDIMDGHFVPNISIGPGVVQSLRKVSKLEFDVHLMIENPERYIEEFATAGADTYILQELDMVLLMTVNPGFGGQKFIPEVLPKIVALSGIIKEVNPNCKIQVDGGINTDTARLVSRAGAEILVAGAAVFAAPDPQTAMKEILQAAEEEQQSRNR